MKRDETDMEYHLSPELAFAFRALARPNGSIRACLLEGPPGAGKTSAAEEFAQRTQSELVYCLLHEQTDDQELYKGIDVQAAVAGDAENVPQPGVLARAAETSLNEPTVLVLDEVDKVRERVEYMLLDFLQTGRVPVRPGVQIQADKKNLVVFLTSNGVRELSEALMRRCRRVRVPAMGKDTLIRLASERVALPVVVIRHAVAIGMATAQDGGFVFTLQELIHLLKDLELATCLQDVTLACRQWCARDEKTDLFVRRHGARTMIWGELRKWRMAE